MPHRFLVVNDRHDAPMAEAVMKAYPGSITTVTSQSDAAVIEAGRFDIVVLAAERLADFARVRQIRRLHRGVGIIAVGKRDRSSEAYLAGANEFAMNDDTAKIISAIQDVLAYRQGIPGGSTGEKTI